MTPQPYVSHQDLSPVEGWNDPVRGVVTWKTLLSGDRTPSEALTLGVAEVGATAPADLRLHRHAHPEVYYVLSGQGVVQIEGVDHPLSQGSVAFIPGGAIHAARGVGVEPMRLLYVFAADSFDEVEYEFPEAGPTG